MANNRLTDQEIAARMVELRNLRRSHVNDNRRVAKLEADNRALRHENKALKQTVETLKIQIAELQTMVFGKRKRPPINGTPVAPDLFAQAKQPRSKASYRRPVPPATAITAEVAVPLPTVCTCGGSFDPKRRTVHNRYEEDIPLASLTPNYQAHLVTRYTVERGVCLACGKAVSSKPLGGQAVTLGPHVQLLIVHLISFVGLSYAQVASLLLGLYGIVVSDGEIANALHKQHKAWLPAYQQLGADIRASPVRHYDETPWKIQAADNAGYAWVMGQADSPKTLFHLATSRGTRHARDLHGIATGVRISDDYGVYRNLLGQQQLCWVHLYRVIRDLRYNANLPKDQTTYVAQWYSSFATIYQDLRRCLSEPYDAVVRATQAAELWQRIKQLAIQTTPQLHKEPEKLRRLKAQLLRAGQDKLFVCLIKNTPCDNNRAERDLRQLVLKRKRSFGSKTERGARALATALSICTTTWRSNPTGYFSSLAALG